MIDLDTDWKRVERVKAGDHETFDPVMSRHKRPVLNVVFRMIGNASEAQDVTQDVFVRAYRGMVKPAFRARHCPAKSGICRAHNPTETVCHVDR